MNLNLQGKRAVVCGSTQGIGRAAAMELAAMGAKVVLIARNEESLKQTLSQLPGSGHSYQVADFSSPETVRMAAEKIAEKDAVHILVNNTGGPPAGPIVNAKAEEFLKAFTSHLICNHILVQAFLPGMKQTQYGRIINVISTSVKQPLKNLGVSNTTRAAVANWSKTLAGEVAEFGITVNNVLPGATATQRLESIINNKAEKTGTNKKELEHEMLEEIPMKRFADPSETAAAIAFLASPAAAYITGINLPVDGGRTACL
jgi:3-oxoacyl-[acyl-carrier protein] reductase